ncbi:MAG: hypothetical protein QHJ34_12235 [bacterium]|jgi:hypothetical protein|nr:hypothetical protein [candidate division KSB1 bacterium]MDH7560979.1 hypothetical protein [bacterium]
MTEKLAAALVWAAAVVASVGGAVQLSGLASPSAPPDCARGEYNYGTGCRDACSPRFLKQCEQVGGTVACCYHYDRGRWECFCIVE